MGSKLSVMPPTHISHILAAMQQFWVSFWGSRKREISKSEFDSLSDEEIISRLETFDFKSHALGSTCAPFLQQVPPVYLFAPNTVVKRAYEKTAEEPYMMEMVWSQTSIPLPKVRRRLFWKHVLYIFMEYVEGDDLSTVWSSLSLWGKLRVAWTLRSYVQQLRQIKLPHPDIPGPIDGSGKPMQCKGHYFTERGAGPFASYADMSSWYASKRRITIALERQISDGRNEPYTPKDLCFDATMPLVFTHGDISLNNIRMGSDGTIWLIDWAYSGAYPPFFEYSSIMAYDDGRGTPLSWLRLAPFMAGRHHSRFVFLRSIDLALTYFAMQEG